MLTNSRLRFLLRNLVRLAAALLGLQLVFAITGPPRALRDWLVGKGLEPRETPRTIVVLGGGGIPSESSLIRLYHAAQYGAGMTGTTFIVSLPADENPDANSVGRMRGELVLRGIPATQIRMETRGLGTRDQAVNIRSLLGESARQEPLVVVTSGYHVRRAVLAFRAAGFTNVRGLHAASIEAEADFGLFAWLRYGLWNNLACEADIMRELIALAFYKLRGWV
jgi:uncharacterized SAM-binding protein YcdF (DUF218 family)